MRFPLYLVVLACCAACNGIVDSSEVDDSAGGEGQGGLDVDPSLLDCDGDGVSETPRSDSDCSACGDACDVARGLMCGVRVTWQCLRDI